MKKKINKPKPIRIVDIVEDIEYDYTIHLQHQKDALKKKKDKKPKGR